MQEMTRQCKFRRKTWSDWYLVHPLNQSLLWELDPVIGQDGVMCPCIWPMNQALLTPNYAWSHLAGRHEPSAPSAILLERCGWTLQSSKGKEPGCWGWLWKEAKVIVSKDSGSTVRFSSPLKGGKLSLRVIFSLLQLQEWSHSDRAQTWF